METLLPDATPNGGVLVNEGSGPAPGSANNLPKVSAFLFGGMQANISPLLPCQCMPVHACQHPLLPLAESTDDSRRTRSLIDRLTDRLTD